MKLLDRLSNGSILYSEMKSLLPFAEAGNISSGVYLYPELNPNKPFDTAKNYIAVLVYCSPRMSFYSEQRVVALKRIENVFKYYNNATLFINSEAFLNSTKWNIYERISPASMQMECAIEAKEDFLYNAENKAVHLNAYMFEQSYYTSNNGLAPTLKCTLDGIKLNGNLVHEVINDISYLEGEFQLHRMTSYAMYKDEEYGLYMRRCGSSIFFFSEEEDEDTMYHYAKFESNYVNKNVLFA